APAQARQHPALTSTRAGKETGNGSAKGYLRGRGSVHSAPAAAVCPRGGASRTPEDPGTPIGLFKRSTGASCTRGAPVAVPDLARVDVLSPADDHVLDPPAIHAIMRSGVMHNLSLRRSRPKPCRTMHLCLCPADPDKARRTPTRCAVLHVTATSRRPVSVRS